LKLCDCGVNSFGFLIVFIGRRTMNFDESFNVGIVDEFADRFEIGW